MCVSPQDLDSGPGALHLFLSPLLISRYWRVYNLNDREAKDLVVLHG